VVTVKIEVLYDVTQCNLVRDYYPSDSSNLEVGSSMFTSETSITDYRKKRHHIPEDCNLQTNICSCITV
jgi:hypothetical protein